MTMREGSVSYLLADGFHRMAYVEWGARDAPPVICVHGLTRQGRDFDRLAAALATDFRVICPDLPGRGHSGWLSDPQLYQVPAYITALSHLLATLDQPVLWVGTSLGGVCGMVLAAQQDQPIRRMVVNDIGPHIPKAALARIREYMKDPPIFDDLAAVETLLRVIHAPFGIPDDAAWREFATHSVRALPGGKLTLHYDPAIANVIRAQEPEDVNLLPFWSKITIPMLVVRGETSDLLLAETFGEMQRAGAEGVTVAGAGHAPALMDEHTIATIATFLRKTPPS
jgi:pimeloyl-ACP methyl ester carboxylesterase